MSAETPTEPAAGEAIDREETLRQASPLSDRARKPVWRDAETIVTRQGQYGFQLVDSLVQGDIDYDDFMARDRRTHEARMDDYFRDQLHIFKTEEKIEPLAPALARRLSTGRRARQATRYALGWLNLAFVAAFLLVLCAAARFHLFQVVLPSAIALAMASLVILLVLARAARFLSKGLWPGLLEERLKGITRRRLRHGDSKFRNLIDQFVVTFIDNNWVYVKWKRGIQLLAIVLIVAAAAPAILPGPPAALNSLVLPLAWFVLCSAVAWIMLAGGTSYVNSKEYRVALKDSAHKISTSIVERMRSLDKLFDRYYMVIQDIQQTGEEQSGVVGHDDINDEKLSPGNGYFATRMLLWLAKRLEYIELHLMHCMQTAQSMQSVQTEAGFVAAASMCVLGVCAVGVMLLTPMTPALPSLALVPAAALQADRIFIAIVAALEIGALSLWSYNSWNSGADILRQYFSAEAVPGWNTFVKLKPDVKLAARSQRAMIKIKELYDKVGMGGVGAGARPRVPGG